MKSLLTLLITSPKACLTCHSPLWPGLGPVYSAPALGCLPSSPPAGFCSLLFPGTSGRAGAWETDFSANITLASSDACILLTPVPGVFPHTCYLEPPVNTKRPASTCHSDSPPSTAQGRRRGGKSQDKDLLPGALGRYSWGTFRSFSFPPGERKALCD